MRVLLVDPRMVQSPKAQLAMHTQAARCCEQWKLPQALISNQRTIFGIARLRLPDLEIQLKRTKMTESPRRNLGSDSASWKRYASRRKGSMLTIC